MTVHLNTWRELLPDSAPSQASARAHSLLLDARWFASLGLPTDRDGDVERVNGWSEATAIFRKGAGTGPIGTLDAPAYHLLRVLDAEPSQAMAKAGDRAARDAVALGQVSFVEFIPAELPFVQNIAVGDYLTEYVRFLFLEIHGGDVGPTRCTYFREQLPWFLAGFFPCGWVGDWPTGRLRVY